MVSELRETLEDITLDHLEILTRLDLEIEMNEKDSHVQKVFNQLVVPRPLRKMPSSRVYSRKFENYNEKRNYEDHLHVFLQLMWTQEIR